MENKNQTADSAYKTKPLYLKFRQQLSFANWSMAW